MTATDDTEHRCFVCACVLNNITIGYCVVATKSTVNDEPVHLTMCKSCAHYAIQYSDFKLVMQAK